MTAYSWGKLLVGLIIAVADYYILASWIWTLEHSAYYSSSLIPPFFMSCGAVFATVWYLMWIRPAKETHTLEGEP